MEDLVGFAAFGLQEPLLASLSALGYEEPTPIQRAAIPPLLLGRDLLGQAATGTGKTAAFALPLLHRVTRDRTTRALVLVPTRELAIQVAAAVTRYGQGLATSVLAVYGGAAMGEQVRALARGVTVVVATPGRALDHLRRKTLRLEGIELLVLDEADEMLDMGFAEDLELLLAATPAGRQTALFSATLPPRITAIAGRHLRDPVRITIARETVAAGALPRVRQIAYVVARAHKPAALVRVLDSERPAAAIVFCRTRTEVDELTLALTGRGQRAEALHGGLSQEQRDRVMKRFRSGVTTLLVATDVAARGLDFEHVSHVVNYDVPPAPEAYVHRIGRTGRAGREGVAITFTEPREQRLLRNLESFTRQRIEMATVPTVADLRARRLDRTRAALREALVAGALDAGRGIVTALAAEFPLADVAAAAAQLLHQATATAEDESEIPQGALLTGAGGTTVRPGVRAARATTATRAPTTTAARKRPTKGAGAAADAVLVRLFIGIGSEVGVRPADLVGAIANEAKIEGRQIGAVKVGARYSLVEVPEALATSVINCLRATTIKGRKVIVRLDRDRSLPGSRG